MGFLLGEILKSSLTERSFFLIKEKLGLSGMDEMRLGKKNSRVINKEKIE